MNFVEKVKQGQLGKNLGITTGLKYFDKAIDGIQKKAIYGIASGPKIGKTTFIDFCFVLEPFLYYKKFIEANPDSKLRIHWIYFSFEVDRVKKELKYAAYFIAKKYKVYNFIHKGKLILMSPRYLEGRLTDDDDQIILLHPEHLEMLKEVYKSDIIPMFGEYDAKGHKISNGFIDFIEEKDNPTGLRNYVFHYAESNGKFLFQKYNTKNEQGANVIKERIVGYEENNPELITIIITDHVRKLRKERGFVMKDNIDKWMEYQVELRNWCKFTFVDVIHINRSLANVERIKYIGEHLYPTGEDVKDTGNLSEDVDYMITIFNPQDEKYKITKHFGLELAEYPNYRSIHLVESRDTECPVHLQTNMFGNVNMFTEI